MAESTRLADTSVVMPRLLLLLLLASSRAPFQNKSTNINKCMQCEAPISCSFVGTQSHSAAVATSRRAIILEQEAAAAGGTAAGGICSGDGMSVRRICDVMVMSMM